jgi:L-type amino acid transporter 5
VNLFFPITFVLICAFLIIVPCYVAPYECGMGLLITLSGIPIYYALVQWQNKPDWLVRTSMFITYACQKLTLSAKEDKDEDDDL